MRRGKAPTARSYRQQLAVIGRCWPVRGLTGEQPCTDICATSAVITTVEVIGKTILRSRDLHIASRPRSLLHCGNDLLVVSAYKAGRAWSTSLHYPFHLAPDRLVEEDPGCGTAGHSGQDPGDDYERAVRTSILWVRVKQHFLPTVRRVLILTLACRWTFLDNTDCWTWIIDDGCIRRIITTWQGLTTNDEITIGARFPDPVAPSNIIRPEQLRIDESSANACHLPSRPLSKCDGDFAHRYMSTSAYGTFSRLLRIDQFQEASISTETNQRDLQSPMRRALLPQGPLASDQPSSGDGIR